MDNVNRVLMNNAEVGVNPSSLPESSSQENWLLLKSETRLRSGEELEDTLLQNVEELEDTLLQNVEELKDALLQTVLLLVGE